MKRLFPILCNSKLHLEVNVDIVVGRKRRSANKNSTNKLNNHTFLLNEVFRGLQDVWKQWPRLGVRLHNGVGSPTLGGVLVVRFSHSWLQKPKDLCHVEGSGLSKCWMCVSSLIFLCLGKPHLHLFEYSLHLNYFSYNQTSDIRLCVSLIAFKMSLVIIAIWWALFCGWPRHCVNYLTWTISLR